MKKFFWTLVVMAVFAVGFAASDEEDGSSADSSKTQVETKKSENKDKIEAPKQQLSPKEKEVADAGRKRGSLFGMSADDNEELKTMLDMAEYVDGMDEKIEKIFGEMAGNDYDNEYSAPTNAEENKLKKIYIENFIKSMNETMETMDKLKN